MLASLKHQKSFFEIIPFVSLVSGNAKLENQRSGNNFIEFIKCDNYSRTSIKVMNLPRLLRPVTFADVELKCLIIESPKDQFQLHGQGTLFIFNWVAKDKDGQLFLFLADKSLSFGFEASNYSLIQIHQLSFQLEIP